MAKSGRPLPRHKIRRFRRLLASSANVGTPIKATRSQRQRKQRSADGAASFYAFAFNTYHGEWRYPVFKARQDAVYTSTFLTQTFSRPTPELGELWRRIAVDQAMMLDDMSIDPTTLRLFRVKFSIAEVTAEMFENEGMFEQSRKLTLMARLSDEEAKLLGLTKEKAVYKISANPDSHPDDQRLLRAAEEAGNEIDGNSIFDALD